MTFLFLLFVIDYLQHGLSYSTEHGGVDVLHGVIHGVPSGRKACLRVMADNIDAGYAGNLVDGKVVIGNHSTIGIGEPLAVTTGVGCSPHLIYDVLCEIIRVAFAMEAGILATYHIEQYAKACHITFCVRHTSPIL